MDRVEMSEHSGEVGLSGQKQLVVQRAGALSSQPHLARGLLTGHVKGASARERAAVRDLQEQGRLSDPGLARQ
jgi:hypothetical protein